MATTSAAGEAGASRALVAPDKFKGTFSAEAVAAAIAAGLRDAGVYALELPVADGGDGTAAALLRARGGAWHGTTVNDPLGRPVSARFALLGDGGTAVVDVAEASGLWRLAADERDPWAASTAGTGQLVAAAADAGARTVIVAAGGSATVDGGAGAVAVLRRLRRRPRLVVACDVMTEWSRAAALYGPQKGADPELVRRLERRLDEVAAAAPRDPRGIRAAGAAGGLAGGLWAHFDAELLGGAGLVLDSIGFDAAVQSVAFVVTGEGRIDDQTLEGKAVGEVARRAVAARRPCYAVVGRDELGAEGRRALGLAGVAQASDERALRFTGHALAELVLDRVRTP